MSGKGCGPFWSLDSICTAVLRKTQLRSKESSRLGTYTLHRSGNHTILLLFDAVAVRLTKQSWGLTELICYLFNLDDWLHEKVHGTLIVLCRGFQKHSLEFTVKRWVNFLLSSTNNVNSTFISAASFFPVASVTARSAWRSDLFPT